MEEKFEKNGKKLIVKFCPTTESTINEIPFEKYVLLVHIDDEVIPYESLEKILKHNPSYIMCCGNKATELDDLFDEAIVLNNIKNHREDYLITTMHYKQSLEDILFFAFRSAMDSQMKVYDNFFILIYKNLKTYHKYIQYLKTLDIEEII